VKPAPAIVEAAPVDVELLAEHIIVALNDERSIDSQIKNLEGRLEDARGTRRMRRIEIGNLLLRARKQWPERGPNAKGWTQFLAAVRLDDSTAWRYMDEAKNPSQEVFSQNGSGNDAEAQGNRQSAPVLRENSAGSEPDSRDREPVNGNGGSGDPLRGTYCTPKDWAIAVGSWDLDPFSNPRSHILAADHLSLERGDDGLLDLAQPGSFYRAPRTDDEKRVAQFNRDAFMFVATAGTRVFLQPPYELAAEAIGHYGHTRFCALLRLDPSPEWAETLWPLVKRIAIPFRVRLEFEGPPGIETSKSPYPHAFYYTHEEDVTDEIRRRCIVLAVVDWRAAVEEACRRSKEAGA
jgi:hypothetical protein